MAGIGLAPALGSLGPSCRLPSFEGNGANRHDGPAAIAGPIAGALTLPGEEGAPWPSARASPPRSCSARSRASRPGRAEDGVRAAGPRRRADPDRARVRGRRRARGLPGARAAGFARPRSAAGRLGRVARVRDPGQEPLYGERCLLRGRALRRAALAARALQRRAHAHPRRTPDGVECDLSLLSVGGDRGAPLRRRLDPREPFR